MKLEKLLRMTVPVGPGCVEPEGTPMSPEFRVAVQEVTEKGVRVIVHADGHDSETLHYVDPPYMHETRNMRRGNAAYEVEMTIEDHEALLARLQDLQGMVVLSGYRTELYDTALVDWRRVDRIAKADGASDRVESLWLNPAAGEYGQQHLLATDC